LSGYDNIAHGGRERIQWHRKQGHPVAIVSASTAYAVKPIANALDLGEAYVATEQEIHDGRFTGGTIEHVFYGSSEFERPLTYAARHGVDLRKSYFTATAFPTCHSWKRLAIPIAANPNRKLARSAAGQ
jgi:phosphoserine phosphatase